MEKSSPRIFRTCTDILSIYDYGCEVSDVEIDGARFESISYIDEIFASAGDELGCLDVDEFVQELAKSFRDDAAVHVPYGVGTYTGLVDMTEYLTISFVRVNHGFWIPEFGRSDDLTAKARFEISENGGRTWYLGSTQGTQMFLGGRDMFEGFYSEQEIIFEECETKISEYRLLPTEDFANELIPRYVQIAEFSQRYGIEDICRYHTTYCADDPSTTQYVNEEECIDYMRSLPAYTDACGPNRPLAGLSIPCKFKHHFMVPANPELHCPHIGKGGVVDMNGNYKCDDVYECSDDEGQDSWPPVVNIGDDTPAERLALYAEDNVGYEDEPYGCVIPSSTT